MPQLKSSKILNVPFRLMLSAIAALVVAVLLPTSIHLPSRILAAWDVGMVCFLGLTGWIMVTATPDAIRHHAQQQDVGRLVILGLITAAACMSVFAIGFMLRNSKHLPPDQLGERLVLCLITIVSAWLLVHTIFAIHYAHGYYQDGSKPLRRYKEEELDFPGDIEPDYWDFLYFSFIIGMTSQVSDVQILSRSLRRLALLHGILSFFFNTMILAMSINIIAGLIQAS